MPNSPLPSPKIPDPLKTEGPASIRTRTSTRSGVDGMATFGQLSAGHHDAGLSGDFVLGELALRADAHGEALNWQTVRFDLEPITEYDWKRESNAASGPFSPDSMRSQAMIAWLHLEVDCMRANRIVDVAIPKVIGTASPPTPISQTERVRHVK